jgi:hypothetical protein
VVGGLCNRAEQLLASAPQPSVPEAMAICEDVFRVHARNSAK